MGTGHSRLRASFSQHALPTRASLGIQGMQSLRAADYAAGVRISSITLRSVGLSGMSDIDDAR
jgi:hypothetical protein